MDEYTEFTDSETKKVAALQEIANTVDRLDITLTELKGADNKLKAWYEQKKAVYEIKKILHDATHYERYNQAEADEFMSEYNSFIRPKQP